MSYRSVTTRLKRAFREPGPWIAVYVAGSVGAILAAGFSEGWS